MIRATTAAAAASSQATPSMAPATPTNTTEENMSVRLCQALASDGPIGGRQSARRSACVMENPLAVADTEMRVTTRRRPGGEFHVCARNSTPNVLVG